jgi:hypothetical protein
MRMIQYIDSLRQKPEHVRQRIALAAASAVTGIVALSWAGTLAATGAFSLAPTSRQVPTALVQVTPTAAAASDTDTNFNELLGAVGAGLGTTAKSELTIEDSGTSSTLDRAAPTASSATVLTF